MEGITITSYKALMSKESEGSLSLIYGDTGVGKTVNTLKTCPDPVIYIRSEPRETKRSMRAVDRPDIKMKIVDHDGFDNLIEFLSTYKMKGVRCIFIDSLSHLMNVRLSGEVGEQAFEARDNATKAEKMLVQQVKLTQEGYGAVGGNMFRIMQILMKLSVKHNITIVCTASEESRPKWNRLLVGAPAFTGKMFSNNFQGFFDLIGRVSTVTRDGKILYPPKVEFASPDGSFLAKATGDMEKFVWPLNWQKILAL